MADQSQVTFAIRALYGTDAAAQQQATQWLTQFTNEDRAWETALNLLQPGNAVEEQFFCANILLTKVRTGWAKLSPELRNQLTSAIR